LKGRDGLQTEMALLETMPFEPDSAIYLVGVYPLEPETNRAH
jgi:hypothetical protein